jgi:phosphatidylglycerol:prolipoprotein diacylglycerol transferase
MALLLWLSRRFKDRLKTGDIFLVYLIVYPFGRFWLEFLRLDSSQLGGVNDNQVFMFVVLVVASIILAWRHRKNGKVQPADSKSDLPDTGEQLNG